MAGELTSIPPSRSLMLTESSTVSGQHPISLHGKELAIFPDWYVCSRKYITSLTRTWGAFSTSGSGSYNVTWYEPFQQEGPDESGTVSQPFGITPTILMVENTSPGSDFIKLAEKVWGVQFRFAENNTTAYAFCPSDSTPKGTGGEPFVDKSITGSVCFVTRVDCTDWKSTSGYNGNLKNIMAAEGHTVCYIACEVDPNKLECNNGGWIMEMCQEGDTELASRCVNCVKGVKVYASGNEVDLNSLEQKYYPFTLTVRYLVRPLYSTRAPTTYGTAVEWFVGVHKGDKAVWEGGKLPGAVPRMTEEITSGDITKELGI